MWRTMFTMNTCASECSKPAPRLDITWLVHRMNSWESIKYPQEYVATHGDERLLEKLALIDDAALSCHIYGTLRIQYEHVLVGSLRQRNGSRLHSSVALSSSQQNLAGNEDGNQKETSDSGR